MLRPTQVNSHTPHQPPQTHLPPPLQSHPNPHINLRQPLHPKLPLIHIHIHPTLILHIRIRQTTLYSIKGCVIGFDVPCADGVEEGAVEAFDAGEALEEEGGGELAEGDASGDEVGEDESAVVEVV